jgi:hypothetical protein
VQNLSPLPGATPTKGNSAPARARDVYKNAGYLLQRFALRVIRFNCSVVESQSAPHSQTVSVSLTSAALRSLKPYYCCIVFQVFIPEHSGRISAVNSNVTCPYDARQVSFVSVCYFQDYCIKKYFLKCKNKIRV